MVLTERDVEILKLIGVFGFMQINHIENYFNLKRPRSYQVVKRLVDSKYIENKRILHGQEGIYKLRKKGIELIGDVTRLRKVALGSFEHDLRVIDVFIRLKEQYPYYSFLTEKQIRSDRGVGAKGHIPDLIFIDPDGKQYAIEIELNPKGKRMIETIIKYYKGAVEYKEIWYFCSSHTYRYLQGYVGSIEFIKTFKIDELLA